MIDAVGEVAEETGRSYAQIALNWLLGQPGVVSPIIGARRMDQLEDNLGAAGWDLEGEQARKLSEAAPPEPSYPARFIEDKQRV